MNDIGIPLYKYVTFVFVNILQFTKLIHKICYKSNTLMPNNGS